MNQRTSRHGHRNREASTALARYVFDLSSTEWAEWPDSEVMNAVVFAARGSVNDSPDHRAGSIRELLARRHRVEPEQIVLGNGAGDLLQTAALALLSRGDELAMPWPSYPLYPLMARRAGARPVPAALTAGGLDPDALLAAVGPSARAVAICNPNDPTGAYMDSQALRGLLSRLPAHLHVLLDEALIQFQDREAEDACLRLVDEYPRLVVFRSFSCAYALSGLRAGYAVGSTAAAALLDAMAPVLGVNTLTQAAVEHLLRRGRRDLAARRSMIIEQRDRLFRALGELPFEAPESQAHFVWLRAPGMSGAQLTAALDRAGIVVAPGGFLGDHDHVRVSLRSPAAVDRLLSVLATIAAEAWPSGLASRRERTHVPRSRATEGNPAAPVAASGAYAHAVEMAREGVPLKVIQRQLGHVNLGVTSVYLDGIDTAEIIAAVHNRRPPMISASAGLLI